MKRCGKKRAIIAIVRMILTAIYQILSTGEQWNPILNSHLTCIVTHRANADNNPGKKWLMTLERVTASFNSFRRLRVYLRVIFFLVFLIKTSFLYCACEKTICFVTSIIAQIPEKWEGFYIIFLLIKADIR